MSTPPFEPVRFLDQPLQERPGEVARLIRHAIGASEKPTPVLKGRIRQTLRRRSVTRRRAMRALLVGGAIFVSGGVVGAVVHPILRLRSQVKIESVESINSSSPSRRARAARPARPPGVSILPAPEVPAPLVVPQLPAAATRPPVPEVPTPLVVPQPPAAAIPVPAAAALTVERPAASTPTKAAVSPARAPRTRERAEPPAPGIPIAPVRPQASSHPLQVAMREPFPPPTTDQAPAPLQPPAFKASTPPASVDGAGQVPLRPSSLLATPPKVTPRTPPVNLPLATAPAAQPAGPQASEQVLVARALSSLRVQRRPATALAALDEYQERFPKGSMLAEVARLRAEALLVLGQRRAALDELNREPAVGATMDEESRLVRAELRASEGRWREASQDFDVLASAWLARHPRDDLSPKLQGRFERVLWGRACARSQLGDEAGARADLQQLLLRFPQGRFAAQAARRLGEPPTR